MARDPHPDIDEAEEAYVEIRDARQELTPREVAAKAELLALMKKHNLLVYKTPSGATVRVVVESETVKVENAKPKKEV